MNSLLLIGDSNFLVSAIPSRSIASNKPKPITFASELYRLLAKADEPMSIFNHAVWGSTLFDFFRSSIIAGPLVTHSAKTCIIGFGTNDANYYYSLNSNIISPGLHRSLLEHLITVIYTSSDISSCILLPIPPVCIRGDSIRNHKVNQAIHDFNRQRQNLAQSRHLNIEYLSPVNYNKSHISSDGYHLNADGIMLLAQEVCASVLRSCRTTTL